MQDSAGNLGHSRDGLARRIYARRFARPAERGNLHGFSFDRSQTP